MPLVNNKVGDDATGGTDAAAAPAEEQALVESLMKVVACFRHLSSCVGGCTDTLQLRDELRKTREKAQGLAGLCCLQLTAHLRDKSLPEAQRREMELLWVAFSSGLELHHADLCKVFGMAGGVFCLANTNVFVQTGMQGGGAEVAARALSLPDLHTTDPGPALPESLEPVENSTMEQEIGRVERMIEDMEAKVRVFRWTVEPRGDPENGDPLSGSDSVSLGLLSVQEDGADGRGESPRRRLLMGLLLCGAVLAVASLSFCIVFFS